MDPTERALKQITTIQIEESKPIRLPDHSLGVTSYRARRRNDYQLRLDHAHYLKFTQGGISVKDK